MEGRGGGGSGVAEGSGGEEVAIARRVGRRQGETEAPHRFNST